MIPILFDENETDFDNNGMGKLVEAISCQVKEEKNGEYELEMVYPVSGKLFEEIKHSRIIFAKPGDGMREQPFRIYKIGKPINGKITVNAQHISYQLSCIPVMPFKAQTIGAAFSGLKSNAAEDCPYTFWTDVTTSGNFSVEVPKSMRSCLGGEEGSILDIYGGEYEFDRYMIRLCKNRGNDNGVTLRYGKNITDIKQEENISNTVTGVCPYWTGTDGVVVTLPEKVIWSKNKDNFPYHRTIPLDLSSEFDEKPTESALRNAAEKYISKTGIGIPEININVKFEPLWQTEEYKNIVMLERVQLCDIVTVEFEKLGISAKAKVIRTIFDVLKDKYKEIEIGDARGSFAEKISNQEKEIKRKTSSHFLNAAIDRATEWITGANGGYVILHKDGNGQPYEILVMDTPDISTATDVWRWNRGGLGHSSNGYNGPYTTAITQDGQIVANFITAGVLQGIQIIAESGKIAGWDIGPRAIYKDFTVGSTVYRAYFQSPQSSTDWVFSCQTSNDGGKTFTGNFYARADGKVYANNIEIAGGSINISTNSEDDSIININFGDRKVTLYGGSIDVEDQESGLGAFVYASKYFSSMRLYHRVGTSQNARFDVSTYPDGHTNMMVYGDESGGSYIQIFADSSKSAVSVANGGSNVAIQTKAGSPTITMTSGQEQVTMDYDSFYNASLS